MKFKALFGLLAAGLMATSAANATELEVTHWWTSGGEAAAVAEFAKAFDASGDKWIDGAIAGSGGTARPIMISRITGGDPMGATQFNHGNQALELVEAGLMLDLTDVAEANNWKEIIFPKSLLDACTVDGRIYCAPVNIHSPEWLWLSNKFYADIGIQVPTTFRDTNGGVGAPGPTSPGVTGADNSGKYYVAGGGGGYGYEDTGTGGAGGGGAAGSTGPERTGVAGASNTGGGGGAGGADGSTGYGGGAGGSGLVLIAYPT